MALTDFGLGNNGYTQCFKFYYDDSLSPARGQALAGDLMQYCDEDFLLVSSWFPGTFVDTPIQVRIENINAASEVGAVRVTWGPLPLAATVCLKLGEFEVTNGTPALMLRYLLVTEVSEVFMLKRQVIFNDWGELPDEGSKGEALSRFLGIQFLIRQGCHAIPEVTARPHTFNMAEYWLRTARTDDFISVNNDVIIPNEVTGCALLFLFYLHDQLGFDINTIIAHGGATLADVYHKLTGDSKDNAWNSFAGIVNSHCPPDSTVVYRPPLDNIFPVADLSLIGAPEVVSWVSNGNFDQVALYLTHATTIDARVGMASDDPAVIGLDPVAVVPGGRTCGYQQLNVRPQPGSFTGKVVNVSATYGGQTLTKAIRVVRPENLVLPPLEIAPKTSGNPCERLFVEGSAQDFTVRNLNVIDNHNGLTYSWSAGRGIAITGANSGVLSISALPAAGTRVTLHVTVANAYNIHAHGSFEFTTIPRAMTLADRIREMECHVRHMSACLPRGIPPEIETVELNGEQLARLESQSEQIMLQAKNVIAAVRKIGPIKEGK